MYNYQYRFLKGFQYSWACLSLLLGLALTNGCVSLHQQNGYNSFSPLVETEQQIIIRGQIDIDDEKIFRKEVVIYPEAFIRTIGGGKIIFEKGVSILGNSQVFDIGANLVFNRNAIGQLNIKWFGARGYDQEDDTQAFTTALALAARLENSINVVIPTGQYYIREQLIVENVAGLNKTINLIGEGISNSTNQGSSLIWNGSKGGVMILMRNNYLNVVQSLDFAAEPGHEVQSNVELRYQIYQMEFRDCSFSGSAGDEAANINLNDGQSNQVSEISFRNCIFRGKTEDNVTWHTSSAIKGGKANTKNIYFEKCSFLGYTHGAINLEVAELLHVNNCTFALNTTDIICLLCSTLATSNYSEQSQSFFEGTNSGNLAFTTMLNNYFDGHPDSDNVITNGSGSLVLINNNFGGNGGVDSVNLVKWIPKNISSIFSIGNFFRNDSSVTSPFLFQGQESFDVHSTGDKMGQDGVTARKYKNGD